MSTTIGIAVLDGKYQYYSDELPVGVYFRKSFGDTGIDVTKLTFTDNIEYKEINKIDSKYLSEVPLPIIETDSTFINLKDASYLFVPYQDENHIRHYASMYDTCTSIELVCSDVIHLYPSDEGVIDVKSLIEGLYYNEDELGDILFGTADCLLAIYCPTIYVHSSDDVDSSYETYYNVTYYSKLFFITYSGSGYYNLYFGNSSILGDFGLEAIVSIDEEDFENLSCEKAVIVNKNWISQE